MMVRISFIIILLIILVTIRFMIWYIIQSYYSFQQLERFKCFWKRILQKVWILPTVNSNQDEIATNNNNINVQTHQQQYHASRCLSTNQHMKSNDCFHVLVELILPGRICTKEDFHILTASMGQGWGDPCNSTVKDVVNDDETTPVVPNLSESLSSSENEVEDTSPRIGNRKMNSNDITTQNFNSDEGPERVVKLEDSNYDSSSLEDDERKICARILVENGVSSISDSKIRDNSSSLDDERESSTTIKVSTNDDQRDDDNYIDDKELDSMESGERIYKSHRDDNQLISLHTEEDNICPPSYEGIDQYDDCCIDSTMNFHICSICLHNIEIGDCIYSTRHCNHTFHTDCIRQWVTSGYIHNIVDDTNEHNQQQQEQHLHEDDDNNYNNEMTISSRPNTFTFNDIIVNNDCPNCRTPLFFAGK
jgi:Ring finger domain